MRMGRRLIRCMMRRSWSTSPTRRVQSSEVEPKAKRRAAGGMLRECWMICCSVLLLRIWRALMVHRLGYTRTLSAQLWMRSLIGLWMRSGGRWGLRIGVRITWWEMKQAGGLSHDQDVKDERQHGSIDSLHFISYVYMVLGYTSYLCPIFSFPQYIHLPMLNKCAKCQIKIFRSCPSL